MTTSFDTTRLDEECERIASEHPFSDVLAVEVKHAVLGRPPPSVVHVELCPPRFIEWTDDCWRTFCAKVFDMCRRPKMVKA